MSTSLATVLYLLLIVGLFWLDRNRSVGVSKGLWIPTIWLLIACTRPVGIWLQSGSVANASDVLDGSPTDRLVDSCLLAAGLFVLLSGNRRVGQFLKANWPILLFFGYGAISILWSDFPLTALKRWIKAWGDVVMVLIVWSDANPIAAIKTILARLAYPLLPLSILFIKYYPALGMTYNFWTGAPIYCGVAAGKNQLGRLCLCLGLGVLWRFYMDYRDHETPGRTYRLIAHCVVLAVALHLFQIMDSMTSLGTFVTASTVLTVANIRAVLRKPFLLHAVVICLLVFMSSLVFLSSSPALLAAFGRNPTLTDRTELWDQVLDLDNSSLFGTGYDSFWLGSRLETLWALNPWRPNEAHNGYLEIFLNLGWIGIALLGVVIVRGYRTCVQAWLAGESTGSLRLAFCFAGLIYNFTEAGFFRTQTGSWLFLLLAIMSLPPKVPASGAGNAERFRQRAQPSPLNQGSLKEATA